MKMTKRIDNKRFAAHKPRRKETTEQIQYRNTRQSEYQREKTKAGQDIGEIPPIINPERRKAATESFRVFCETYLSAVFYLAWSKDLLHVIEKVERVVINHDTLAIAMPRGSGKTQLCLAAVLWAVMTGRHKFVVFVGATGVAATEGILWFKDTLSENELILEDWPEIC